VTGPVRVSAVKLSAEGIRVGRDFEIHDLAVRTAATAALARGEFVDEWLTTLVLAEVAEDATAASPFGTSCDGLGADVDVDVD